VDREIEELIRSVELNGASNVDADYLHGRLIRSQRIPLICLKKLLFGSNVEQRRCIGALKKASLAVKIGSTVELLNRINGKLDARLIARILRASRKLQPGIATLRVYGLAAHPSALVRNEVLEIIRAVTSVPGKSGIAEIIVELINADKIHLKTTGLKLASAIEEVSGEVLDCALTILKTSFHSTALKAAMNLLKIDMPAISWETAMEWTKALSRYVHASRASPVIGRLALESFGDLVCRVSEGDQARLVRVLRLLVQSRLSRPRSRLAALKALYTWGPLAQWSERELCNILMSSEASYRQRNAALEVLTSFEQIAAKTRAIVRRLACKDRFSTCRELAGQVLERFPDTRKP
jgi:hypothetical protein